MRNKIIAGLLALYLLPGIYFGWAATVTLPPINWMGGTYIALTWPLWLKASPVDLPIPDWCFTFEGE